MPDIGRPKDDLGKEARERHRFDRDGPALPIERGARHPAASAGEIGHDVARAGVGLDARGQQAHRRDGRDALERGQRQARIGARGPGTRGHGPQMLAHGRYPDPGEPTDARAIPAHAPAAATRRRWGTRGRWTVAILLASSAMAVGLAVAAIARLPLLWDGAWFLLHALDSSTPTFLFRRAIHVALQAPAMVTATVTGDAWIASVVFSATYVAVPLIALLAAWRVVREERPELIAWAALGIALVALPGLVFFISEGAMVAHLAWALVLAAALGRVGRHRVLVVVLVAVMAVSHPLAGPTLAAVGAVAWLARRRGIGNDGRLVAWSFLVAGIVLSLIFLAVRSAYEVEASTLGELTGKFRASILDPAMVAPVVAWLIGIATFVPMRPGFGSWRSSGCSCSRPRSWSRGPWTPGLGERAALSGLVRAPGHPALRPGRRGCVSAGALAGSTGGPSSGPGRDGARPDGPGRELDGPSGPARSRPSRPLRRAA